MTIDFRLNFQTEWLKWNADCIWSAYIDIPLSWSQHFPICTMYNVQMYTRFLFRLIYVCTDGAPWFLFCEHFNKWMLFPQSSSALSQFLFRFVIRVYIWWMGKHLRQSIRNHRSIHRKIRYRIRKQKSPYSMALRVVLPHIPYTIWASKIVLMFLNCRPLILKSNTRKMFRVLEKICVCCGVNTIHNNTCSNPQSRIETAKQNKTKQQINFLLLLFWSTTDDEFLFLFKYNNFI